MNVSCTSFSPAQSTGFYLKLKNTIGRREGPSMGQNVYTFPPSHTGQRLRGTTWDLLLVVLSLVCLLTRLSSTTVIVLSPLHTSHWTNHQLLSRFYFQSKQVLTKWNMIKTFFIFFFIFFFIIA